MLGYQHSVGNLFPGYGLISLEAEALVYRIEAKMMRLLGWKAEIGFANIHVTN
ncbi:MAG: hypothetical protein ONB31_01095 [candidate division KSB1 bacterium]|nr:hypothetical protein [candidate division KSB1 bacterium]MDZ7334125.1 hypothetical protein [candidate division KSB1 bacterium]MDZ7356286.1 hypothetical protein [candidate division KSB1 bacterium]MDZ7401379.1 hypothetical protein [candidate division KSB1 bacterium]